MSYASGTGGLGTFGGFGYYGLGAAFTIDWVRGNDEVRDLQRELQRLRFLEPGLGAFGADGKWGPRTETALRAAARYVGWEGDAYTADYGQDRKTGTVDVPDDLIERIRAASPAPAGTPGALVGPQPIPATAPVEPAPEELPPVRPSAERSEAGWLPAALIGGGVLAVGAALWWGMRKPKRALASNRKRRRRRRRR